MIKHKQQKTYTEAYHVYRLELMLNKPNLCIRCPHIPLDNTVDTRGFNWQEYKRQTYTNDPCSVCKRFVNISEDYGCPCSTLSAQGKDPIKETLSAIKRFKQRYPKS